MPKETYQFSVIMQYRQSVWVDAESLEEAKKIMMVSTNPMEDDEEHSLYDAEVGYQLHDDYGTAMPVEIHHFDGNKLHKVADVE